MQTFKYGRTPLFVVNDFVFDNGDPRFRGQITALVHRWIAVGGGIAERVTTATIRWENGWKSDVKTSKLQHVTKQEM